MKISISCECLLLEESVRLFLNRKIHSVNESDFVICDKIMAIDKPLFVLGIDLPVPFTKAQFLSALEIFYKNVMIKENSKALEQQIEDLTNNFKHDLLRLLKNAKY